MINTLNTNLLCVAVAATIFWLYRHYRCRPHLSPVFLIRVRGMEISEIIASYAIALAILEGLRWGGFKG